MRQEKPRKPRPGPSVYEGREPLEHDAWTYLGELDPRAGSGFVDYDRARRWQPLDEFLRERQ